MTHIGEILRKERKKHGIKVDDLATKLGYANRQSVYSLEKRESIDLLTLRKVAEVLEVPLSTFIDTEHTDNIHPAEEQITEYEKERNCVNEIYEKDQKIIALQDQIIELQKEVITLTKKLIN